MAHTDHNFELLSLIQEAVADHNGEGRPFDLPALTDATKDIIGDRTALHVVSPTVHPLRIRKGKPIIYPNYSLRHAEGAFRGLFPLTTFEDFTEGIQLERVAIGAILQTHSLPRSGQWVDLSGAEICNVHETSQNTTWAEPIYELLAEEHLSIKALAALVARSNIPPEDEEFAGVLIRSLISPAELLYSVQSTSFTDFRQGVETTFFFDTPSEITIKKRDVFTVSCAGISSRPQLSIARDDIGGDMEILVQVDESCGLVYK